MNALRSGAYGVQISQAHEFITKKGGKGGRKGGRKVMVIMKGFGEFLLTFFYLYFSFIYILSHENKRRDYNADSYVTSLPL